MPKIVAKIKTGGDRLDVTGRVQVQPTAAERGEDPGVLQKLRPAGEPARSRRRDRRTAAGFGGGGGGRGGGFDSAARTQVPAGAAAQLPRDDHDAAADDPAARQPAADEHQELDVLDRRRRPDAARDRARHAVAGLERPLPPPTGGNEALVADAYASRQS